MSLAYTNNTFVLLVSAPGSVLNGQIQPYNLFILRVLSSSYFYLCFTSFLAVTVDTVDYEKRFSVFIIARSLQYLILIVKMR